MPFALTVNTPMAPFSQLHPSSRSSKSASAGGGAKLLVPVRRPPMDEREAAAGLGVPARTCRRRPPPRLGATAPHIPRLCSSCSALLPAAAQPIKHAGKSKQTVHIGFRLNKAPQRPVRKAPAACTAGLPPTTCNAGQTACTPHSHQLPFAQCCTRAALACMGRKGKSTPISHAITSCAM